MSKTERQRRGRQREQTPAPDHTLETEHAIKAPEQPLGSLASDLLWGAEEVAEFINRKPSFVYYAQEALGLTHVGALLVGSKSKLTKLLTGGAQP